MTKKLVFLKGPEGPFYLSTCVWLLPLLGALVVFIANDPLALVAGYIFVVKCAFIQLSGNLQCPSQQLC